MLEGEKAKENTSESIGGKFYTHSFSVEKEIIIFAENLMRVQRVEPFTTHSKNQVRLCWDDC